MRVEIDDLIDHAREQLAAGLARIGAHVQPPDPQRAIVRSEQLGPHLARVEPRLPRPLVPVCLGSGERFVVDQQPELAIGRTDEGGLPAFGEPAVQVARIQFAEPVLAASSQRDSAGGHVP